jgi:TRAP-type C4-dicarboxylate transport system substrate-binding protein
MVRDRFEEDPSELGYMRLIDMETKQSFEGNIDSSTLKSYKKALLKNDEKLYKQFKKQGVRFTKVYTHEDAAIKLMKRMRK